MNNINTAYFFSNPQIESQPEFSKYINHLREYSKEVEKQIYFLNRTLIDEVDYDLDSVGVILKPDHKIIFFKLNDVDDEEFENYIDDFIEDIGYLATKYEHTSILGRPKKWRNSLTVTKTFTIPEDATDNLNENLLENYDDKRNVNLLISLLIGSINDIDNISQTAPEDALTAVKKKIILFDGDQTRFIHKKLDKDIIRIQGLSGTGKTELLLHKLKEIYTSNSESKILVTCHNKILADSLRKRIPKFFDFMKIEQQILWEERLWCIHAWGSRSNVHSGTLRYICAFYDIPFETFSRNTTFENICSRAIEAIKEKTTEKKPFDYIIIDESQDFPESFIQLCELSTTRKVFIAGDIFQSIFDDPEKAFVESDFLLNRCYRTDPKTLMFSHALGMNLFEPDNQLRWLEDEQWEKCGYKIEDYENEYILSRDPVRRFEDIDLNELSVQLIDSSHNLNPSNEIITIIKDLNSRFPTLKPDDIAIVLITDRFRSNNLYDLAKTVEREIITNFDNWECNIAYESKEKVKDKVFITNTNNIKGLEFPFVICICNKLSNTHFIRNSLYMALTRSFLESYLITFDGNSKRINHIKDGLSYINNNLQIKCQVPSIQRQKEINTEMSILNERGLTPEEYIVSLIETRTDSDPKTLSIIYEFLINYVNKNPSITNEDLAEKFKNLIKIYES